MAKRKRSRPRKRGRHSAAGQKSRGNRLGLYILGGLALLVVFYLIDRSGPLETIEGLVVDTRSYNHTSDGDTHTHQEAVFEYEGRRRAERPGDRFGVGDPVTVEVRRGRITGYPYFEQAYPVRP